MSHSEHRLALPPGTLVSHYRIEDVLGEGGFGITYLAEHTGLQRRIALKELLPFELATRAERSQVVARTRAQEDDFNWARDRFLDEGRILARFHHPNIISVHDIFQANGTAYMATGYEQGCDLDHWCRSKPRPIPEPEILAVLAGVLDGLETVHAGGLLHRDIKPQNIYLRADGHPILLDFGSARQAISQKSRAITSIVTPGYAPFEQYHEDGNQGPWTDIYATGGVLYFMLMGQRPPDASKRVLNDPYEPIAARLQGTYSPDFLAAVDWALRPHEHERPQSIQNWRSFLPPLAGPIHLSVISQEAAARPSAPVNPRTQRALPPYGAIQAPGAANSASDARRLPPPLPESHLLPEIEARTFGIATVSLGALSLALEARQDLWPFGLAIAAWALGFVLMHRVWKVARAIGPAPQIEPEPGSAIGRCLVPGYCFYWWFVFYLRPWRALWKAAPGLGGGAPHWLPYAIPSVMVFPFAALFLPPSNAPWLGQVSPWLFMTHLALIAVYGLWVQRAITEAKPSLRNSQRRPAFPFGLLSQLVAWSTARAGVETETPSAPLASDDTFTLEGFDLQGANYRLRFTMTQLLQQGGQIVIGRSPQDSSLIVGNPSVSRRHLRLTWNAASRTLIVEDLESGNGTYVNGKLVTYPTELRRGDQVELGDVRLTLASLPS